MKIKKCPCCNGKNLNVLYTNMYDKDYSKEGNFSIIKCFDCKLEMTYPLLSEEKLKKYYPENYYSFYDYNKLAMIYHKISAYYYSRKNPIINFFLYPFSPLFYTYYLDEGKNILEIGCGNGMKLKIYKKYGMKTFGLEPYLPKIEEKEQKLGIIKSTIKNAPYNEEMFDYIILKEVLEHIPNQEEVLEKSYKWLKKGGKLILTVPNTDGLWKKVFKKNWYGYDIPRHSFLHNPKNISCFLEKSGFKIDKIRIYEMPYMLDGSLKYYMADKRGKNENSLIFSNLMKVVIAPISLILSIFKLGSMMEVHCSK